MSVSTPYPLPFEPTAPASLPSADFQVIIVSPVTVTSEALAETATSDPANAERPIFFMLLYLLLSTGFTKKS